MRLSEMLSLCMVHLKKILAASWRKLMSGVVHNKCGYSSLRPKENNTRHALYLSNECWILLANMRCECIARQAQVQILTANKHSKFTIRGTANYYSAFIVSRVNKTQFGAYWYINWDWNISSVLVNKLSKTYPKRFPWQPTVVGMWWFI